MRAPGCITKGCSQQVWPSGAVVQGVGSGGHQVWPGGVASSVQCTQVYICMGVQVYMCKCLQVYMRLCVQVYMRTGVHRCAGVKGYSLRGVEA